MPAAGSANPSTAATPGSRAALGMCISSLNSTAAAGDAAGASHRRKLRRYAGDRVTLRAANIVYQPMVWSADGRPHPQVTRAMQFAARRARQQDPELPPGSHRDFLQRWGHEIGVSICRRRAAMARAVMPLADAATLAEAFGTPADEAEVLGPLEWSPEDEEGEEEE